MNLLCRGCIGGIEAALYAFFADNPSPLTQISWNTDAQRIWGQWGVPLTHHCTLHWPFTDPSLTLHSAHSLNDLIELFWSTFDEGKNNVSLKENPFNSFNPLFLNMELHSFKYSYASVRRASDCESVSFGLWVRSRRTGSPLVTDFLLLVV